MTRTRPPQPQVSVIVPVYNQEQYLEECISSIRRQTLAEWECIIVNDGSSDSSGEIARRFSEEDSRIRCLEQETSEHVCGMPREQRAYLEAALAGRWIYLRLLQCFWKFKTARRKMFRLRFSKNGIDTLQILGYTLYSAKKLPRSSL